MSYAILQALMHSYPEVKKAVGGSEKIFEYLERKPQIPPEGNLAPKYLKGHVQFQNVKFAYSSDKDNLILKVRYKRYVFVKSATNMSCFFGNTKDMKFEIFTTSNVHEKEKKKMI